MGGKDGDLLFSQNTLGTIESMIMMSKNNPLFHDAYSHTAQKMKFSIKDFFRKCDQICSLLQI